MMTAAMVKYIIRISLCLVLIPQLAGAVQKPQAVVQNAATEVREILKKKVVKGSAEEEAQKTKLKKVVDGFLDYRELALRSLGPHWKERTPAEQRDFVQLLRDLIDASYTGAIRNNINFEIKYLPEEIDPDGVNASVPTVASAKNSKKKMVSLDILFHMYLKDGKWMIYDIEFDDLSLVRHYRSEFNRKIKKESYAALITAMKKKLDEVKAGKFEKKIDIK
jgi:phospholipid transport system substrate-binding protein